MGWFWSWVLAVIGGVLIGLILCDNGINLPG